MDTPDTITFTGFEVAQRDLQPPSRGPMDPRWLRTQFTIPDNYNAPKAVHDWLNQNTTATWASYHYQSAKEHGKFTMVVRFESRNDALMFKLRDGHRSWQTAT